MAASETLFRDFLNAVDKLSEQLGIRSLCEQHDEKMNRFFSAAAKAAEGNEAKQAALDQIQGAWTALKDAGKAFKAGDAGMAEMKEAARAFKNIFRHAKNKIWSPEEQAAYKKVPGHVLAK